MTDDLINGAQEFKYYHYEKGNGAMSELVKEGQNPNHFIISCIDSRCNPGTIFRAKPGSFLSHKAMGAIVRPYKQGTALAAALQFALEYNQIQNIIVLGHTHCGAIKALASELDDPEITSFVNVTKSAHTKALGCCSTQDEIVNKTEQEVILESTQNLKAYPSVAKAIAEQRVIVKSWQFDIQTGNLLEYNGATARFENLSGGIAVEDSRQAPREDE